MLNKFKVVFLSMLTFLLLFMIFINIGLAQDILNKRDFLLYSEYTDIIIEKGTSLDLDLKVINTGKEKEEVNLSLIPDKQAQDWPVYLKTSSWKGFEVRSVGLLTQDPDNIKTIKLHIEVPENAITGNYTFVLKGNTKDQKIKKTQEIKVEVIEKKEGGKEKIPGEIKISSKYPAIENPAGKDFKFSLDVENKKKEVQILDLGIKLPTGWNAYCTPQWKDNRISSVKVNAGSTENLSLTVTPPMFVEKGKYPITFFVGTGENRKDIKLTCIVTGTYKLNLKTKTGQLNIDTIAGEDKIFNIYLWNEGSAPIDNISFFSKTPENWKVSFKPEKISSLLPVVKTQKPEKIEITVKTPQRTLPGDYMINLTAAGTQDQKTLDIRTTVKTSTKWGWLGVGIIIIILFILIGIFIKLKRR